MERDKALLLFTDPAYKAICVNIAGDDADDLYQDLFLYIASLPDDKLGEIVTTCPECWYGKAARLQYRSRSTSHFHKTYRDPAIQALRNEGAIVAALYGTSEPDGSMYAELISRAMDSLHWYDYYVLLYYAEYRSLRVLSRKTRIPVKTLHNSITSSKRIIKKYIHDHIDDCR